MNKSMTRARLARAVLASALLVPLLLWVSGCWLFNIPPIAAFTVSSQAGQVPFAVNFSAVLSEDEDGDIIEFKWDFGDGTSGSGENVTHTYTAAGTVTVVLRVTDDDGETASNSKTLYVTPADPAGPTASFTASPTSGTSPLTVYTDASASIYDAGVISRYDWNWGDGSTGSGKTASHTYFSAGAQTYTITLTITGTDGKTTSATKTISVTSSGGGTTPPVSGAPSARFDIVAAAALGAAGSIGVAPFQALFDPEDTEVSIGKTLLQLIWSFGDGGSTSTANITSQLHAYVTDDPSEVFSVTLLAMDNEAATDSITKSVKVYNHQPVAGFEIANPEGGHVAELDETVALAEHYADEAAAIAADRWDDDRARTNNVKNDGVVMGDLQTIVPAGGIYSVNVFIRSRLTTDLDWFPVLPAAGLDGALDQKTLKMAEGLAAPGSTKPEPDDFHDTNNAFSYDPEGQVWKERGVVGTTTDDYPTWFPVGNQAWGIQWIYVNWDDGSGEMQYDYRRETDSTGTWTSPNRPLYDQDAVIGHTYELTAAGLSEPRTITVRVVDFLGAEATYSRTLLFMLGVEGDNEGLP